MPKYLFINDAVLLKFSDSHISHTIHSFQCQGYETHITFGIHMKSRLYILEPLRSSQFQIARRPCVRVFVYPSVCSLFTGLRIWTAENKHLFRKEYITSEIMAKIAYVEVCQKIDRYRIQYYYFITVPGQLSLYFIRCTFFSTLSPKEIENMVRNVLADHVHIPLNKNMVCFFGQFEQDTQDCANTLTDHVDSIMFTTNDPEVCYCVV